MANQKNRDAVNYIFDFPRFYYKKVIDAVSDTDGSNLGQVADICEGIITLRESIKSYNLGNLDPRDFAEDIEQPLIKLRKKTQKLRQSKKNKYIYSTALSLEVILCLSWPPVMEPAYIHSLADELQQTTSQLPKAPCPYMDLTSCQFIIGAVAAASNSSTRTWFVDKMARTACAMQERGWSEEPFEILGRMLGADQSLARWLGMECGRGVSEEYRDVSRRILCVSLEESWVAV